MSKAESSGRWGRRLAVGMLSTLLVAAGVAVAGTASAGVEAREHRQRDRIRHGVENDSLTRGETGNLVRQQLRIERSERRFRANDGRLGPRERIRLNRAQNRASRNIYRKKHNERER